jgi:hypothetical protein
MNVFKSNNLLIVLASQLGRLIVINHDYSDNLAVNRDWSKLA